MAGVYELYIETHFSAAHALRGYEGDCARIHGHNWAVRVFVRCCELDATGIGVDFLIIEKEVKSLLSVLDHQTLNDLPPFSQDNPTAENIARYLYKELSCRINSKGGRISKIEVSETPKAGALYWEE
jgi:6-pyruvoyltetrahydropterin/6-carboxytetrahydropterin synthase